MSRAHKLKRAEAMAAKDRKKMLVLGGVALLVFILMLAAA